jgi:hypothetical protein
MITEITRILNGVYYASNTTITFDQNPYLLANNDLTLFFTINDARFASRVVSVSANNAVIDFYNPQYANNAVTVHTPNFGSGLTGPQEAFSFKFTNPPSAVIQACSTGGTSDLVVQVSTNKTHWVNVASLNISTANGNSAYTTVTTPWPYGRLNISSIGAGNSITINKVI